MNAKKIVSYTLLGIIAAILVVVIILSFVTKKLSPTVANINASNPTEITVSKYVDSKEYMYRMQKEDMSTDENIKKDYEAVLKKFDGLGYFTYMQQLFLGLGDFKQEIVEGTTSTVNQLHQLTDGYLIEFVYDTERTIKNPDGTEYKDAAGKKFKKLDIFVENSNEVSTYKIYIVTGSDSASVKYVYSICANVNSLYNLAKTFDDAEKLQGKMS